MNVICTALSNGTNGRVLALHDVVTVKNDTSQSSPSVVAMRLDIDAGVSNISHSSLIPENPKYG
jgi:hypothetical protein